MKNKFFQKGELKLLWPFYLDAFINSALFFMPIFVIVYFRDLNFTLFQIGILIAMMPLFTFIFEIPTGAVADLYGRKLSVIISYLLQAIALLSIFFLENYYLILLAFAMRGFASTFSSGAKEAWVIDLIKRKNKNLLHNYFAKVQGISSGGTVLSGLLGVFLVKTFGLPIIWIFAGFSYALSIAILIFAREYFIKRKVRVSESFKKLNKHTIDSLNYSRKHPVLYYFLIATLIIVLSETLGGNLAWVTYLKELRFPDHAFGYLWSAMGLVGVVAPLVSIKLLKKGKERQFILTTLILVGLILLPVLFIFNIALALFIFLSVIFVSMVSEPVNRIYFHKFVPSKMRATIGSIEMMLIGIAGIIGLPLAGFLIDTIGAQQTIFLSAITSIPAVIIFYKIKEEKVKNKGKN